MQNEEYITSNEFQDHKGNTIRYWKADGEWICQVNKTKEYREEHLIDAMIKAIQSISDKVRS